MGATVTDNCAFLSLFSYFFFSFFQLRHFLFFSVAPATPPLPSASPTLPPEPIPLEQPRPLRRSPRGAPTSTSIIDSLTSSLQSSSTSASASSSSSSTSLAIASSGPKFSVPRKRFYKSVRFKLTETKDTESDSHMDTTEDSVAFAKPSKLEAESQSSPRTSSSSVKESSSIEGSTIVTSVRMVMSTFCPLKIDKNKSQSSSSKSDFFSVFSPCLSPPLSSEKKAKPRTLDLEAAEAQQKARGNDKVETAEDIDSLFADVSIASSPRQKPQAVPLLSDAMETDEDVSPVATAASSPHMKSKISPVTTPTACSSPPMDTDDVTTPTATKSPKKRVSPRKSPLKRTSPRRKKKDDDAPASPAVMTRSMRAKVHLDD